MMNSNVFDYKIKISFLSIFFIGLGIRIFYFPFDLPLIIDGMDNFTYSTAINYYGHLPLEWTPINNGWPIFVSFWFSIIELDNTFQYMQLQRIISIVLSSLITIPVYFLCKKFFDEKIALVGVAFIVFDPRLILNSLLGITEPLFILLGITSLVLFLKYERRLMFLSFIFASCCTIVRSEGIFLFFTLTILFFIKYKISKDIFKIYFPCIVVFMLILIPIMDYRIEVAGYDGIFQRAALGTGQILSMTNNSGDTKIVDGIELFVKYLGWIMIPNFLLFLPLGAILFLKNRTKNSNFIIIFTLVSSIPIFYAYIVQAQDTRYLYFLFPIFTLISLYSVRIFISKISHKDIALFIIILGILFSSIGFYEYLKNDYTNEKEQNEISKIISDEISGINFHPTLTHYMRAGELPSMWPFVFNDKNHKIKIISTMDYNNLDNFIINSKDDLTHIIVDDNIKLPKYLQDVYYNGEEVEYLDKVFDSKLSGFNHHSKLFKINYEKFIFIKN